MENGLFLTHAKYSHDILSRAALLDAKPTSTPLSTSDYLVTSGSPCSYPTLYRSLVDVLQYLTITRPDLSYAVNQVNQLLHAPTSDHFQVVKRILDMLTAFCLMDFILLLHDFFMVIFAR